MKKKTLAFLLSACLLTQSAGFVSAADFSAVPEEAANAEEIFSPEANATDSDPSDNLSATGGDDFSDEHPDHMTTIPEQLPKNPRSRRTWTQIQILIPQQTQNQLLPFPTQ